MNTSQSNNLQKGFQTAKEVLAHAETHRPKFGHSPHGFLSQSHGFLPVTPPLLALPQAYRAWDEAAAILPELFSTQRVCPVLKELPLLSATTEDLDEVYLWRATLLLGYIAHAYAYMAEGKSQLPSAIAVPWEQVNQRLGRPGPGLSIIDQCNYNWLLKEDYQSRQVENLDLLVTWCGNKEERVFLNSITDMQSDSGLLVNAAINLQEGIIQNQVDNIKTALLSILDFISKITFRSLLKIDPNPYSNTYVDPLIWSKAFASFATPINALEPGPSGSGTPIIQLIDTLFERSSYKTIVSHQSLELRKWMPLYHQQFIETFRRFSLSEFVQKSEDRELAGIYNSVFDAYAGKRGFLSIHRLKVYGFMELGFKIGRTETNSGFAGETEKRAWEELDDTLEETRRERYLGKLPYSLRVKRKAVKATASENTPIYQVVLDLKNQGLQFVTGDRLGIFPQNSSELVDKTIKALQATGDEPIRLTSAWREQIESITHQRLSTIPLGTFLAYAKLRPLLRSVGKLFLNLSRSKSLYDILERHQEDQIELWEVFELLAAENYDVKRFWKAAPWETESIARIVPPENFRIYSISSAPLHNNEQYSPDELALTIGRLAFKSNSVDSQTQITRQGTASGYLVQKTESELEMAVQVFHPSRFHLPEAPQRPIVMFAGGTGISPFRGFMEQRRAETSSGPNWLFIGTRTFSNLPYLQELKTLVAEDKLHLRVAFSREDKKLAFEQGDFVLKPGQKGYVNLLLEDEADSARLWQYLTSLDEGGLEGYFYICGQASFGHTVIEGIVKLIEQHLPDTIANKQEEAQIFLRRLVGQGRLMLDIFTTFAPFAAPSVHGFKYFNASEIINHNNDRQGYWTIIQGNVYDVSEFMYLHPGGERLLIASAGMDSTRSYEKVEHHLNSEVHSQLDLYKIGGVRRLNFKDVWGIAITPPSMVKAPEYQGNAFMFLSLQDFYRHWIRLVYLVVETENSLNNNFSVSQLSITRGNAPEKMTKMKAQLLLNSHNTFYKNSLEDVFGQKLELLWNITLGFCADDISITQLPRAITKERSSAIAKEAEAFMTQLSNRLKSLPSTSEANPDEWADFNQQLQHLEDCDRALITNLKLTLRDGLLMFEEHEDSVPQLGNQELIKALQKIPKIIQHYYKTIIAPEQTKTHRW